MFNLQRNKYFREPFFITITICSATRKMMWGLQELVVYSTCCEEILISPRYDRERRRKKILYFRVSFLRISDFRELNFSMQILGSIAIGRWRFIYIILLSVISRKKNYLEIIITIIVL